MSNFFQKHIFLPQDHGSWVFVFSPIFAGLFISGRLAFDQFGIILAAISFFLVRQPLTVIVKVYSGRRDDKDLAPAIFWCLIYGFVFLCSLGLLIYFQQTYVIAVMALPAVGMLAWQFVLVVRRNERKQKLFEVLSTGLLAFIAAAILWVGKSPFDTEGLVLWLLLFLQSAASIFYAYTRLEQRVWKGTKPLFERVAVSASTLLFTLVNLIFCVMLGHFDWANTYLWLAFCVQFLETIHSLYNPATGYKPTHIGFRQTIVSALFLVLLIIFW